MFVDSLKTPAGFYSGECRGAENESDICQLLCFVEGYSQRLGDCLGGRSDGYDCPGLAVNDVLFISDCFEEHLACIQLACDAVLLLDEVEILRIAAR